MSQPLVSVVIPTYNEAADIRETLESLIALDYENKEIIAVDASHDETPQIVRSYSTQQTKLIIQSRGKGRAAARNEGILAARGEIVIILNADVRLPRDFIQHILQHYETGADYVLVESRVTNLESSIARYLQAMHEWQYPPRPEIEANMNWTEGFSCRREAALSVGGIPEGDLVPLLAGEDGWFGEKLAAAGYRKVFDRSILVTHVMPPDLKTFWRQRAGRSQGTTQIWATQHHWSFNKIVEATIKSCLLGIAGLLIPISALTRCWRLAKFSSRGARDFFVFSLIDWIASTANVWGMVEGIIELRKAGVR